ncbi:hypothetical protein ACI6Q2_02195 [Chitinophagaceae bacterium LWZ2-11]
MGKAIMMVVKFFKKMVAFIGFDLVRKKQFEPAILHNVFKSEHTKKALLSYMKAPFLEGVKYTHSNYLECYTAGEILHELGFQVDVADWHDNITEPDFSQYELVYGQGCPLEKAFYASNAEKLIKILYATGCNPFYAYKASALRVLNFYEEKKILLPNSSRIAQFFWSFQYTCSDLIISLGNQFVSETFTKLHKNIHCSPINCFFFDAYDIDIDSKNLSEARHNFLWFGSTGLLHKGLDIAIDIFTKRTDINLHICGASKSETKFFEYYQPIIDNCSNIYDHGFVDIYSDKFRKLMDSCAFAIFPSVSEGGSPALLNVMANGALIPIAFESVGIDIKEFGLLAEESFVGINNAIEVAIKMDEQEILSKSKFTKHTIRSNYQFEDYRINLKKIIANTISSLTLN